MIYKLELEICEDCYIKDVFHYEFNDLAQVLKKEEQLMEQYGKNNDKIESSVCSDGYVVVFKNKNIPDNYVRYCVQQIL